MIEVIGASEVAASFARAAAGAHVGGIAVTTDAAEHLVELARSFAARDTGFMADTLGYDVRVITGGVEVTVGSEADYDHFVENGTADTAPQPFYGPAADATEPVLVKKMEGLAIAL